MIKDLATSIKATLYERISSPLAGSFIVSWILWNYKILIILFSSYEALYKINYIGEALSFEKIIVVPLLFGWTLPIPTFVGKGLLFPLLTALAYLFVYPYPSKWIYSYWKRRQKELKEKQQEIDKSILLSIEDSIAIKKEALEIESKYIQEIDRKNNEIKVLNVERNEFKSNIQGELINKDAILNEKDKIIEEKDKIIVSLKNELSEEKLRNSDQNIATDLETKNTLPKEHLNILKQFANNKHLNLANITNLTKSNLIRTEHTIEMLISKNYIKGSSAGYSLTTEGRDFLLQHNII